MPIQSGPNPSEPRSLQGEDKREYGKNAFTEIFVVFNNYRKQMRKITTQLRELEDKFPNEFESIRAYVTPYANLAESDISFTQPDKNANESDKEWQERITAMKKSNPEEYNELVELFIDLFRADNHKRALRSPYNQIAAQTALATINIPNFNKAMGEFLDTVRTKTETQKSILESKLAAKEKGNILNKNAKEISKLKTDIELLDETLRSIPKMSAIQSNLMQPSQSIQRFAMPVIELAKEFDEATHRRTHIRLRLIKRKLGEDGNIANFAIRDKGLGILLSDNEVRQRVLDAYKLTEAQASALSAAPIRSASPEPLLASAAAPAAQQDVKGKNPINTAMRPEHSKSNFAAKLKSMGSSMVSGARRGNINSPIAAEAPVPVSAATPSLNAVLGKDIRTALGIEGLRGRDVGVSSASISSSSATTVKKDPVIGLLDELKATEATYAKTVLAIVAAFDNHDAQAKSTFGPDYAKLQEFLSPYRALAAEVNPEKNAVLQDGAGKDSITQASNLIQAVTSLMDTHSDRFKANAQTASQYPEFSEFLAEHQINLQNYLSTCYQRSTRYGSLADELTAKAGKSEFVQSLPVADRDQLKRQLENLSILSPNLSNVIDEKLAPQVTSLSDLAARREPIMEIPESFAAQAARPSAEQQAKNIFSSSLPSDTIIKADKAAPSDKVVKAEAPLPSAKKLYKSSLAYRPESPFRLQKSESAASPSEPALNSTAPKKRM